MMMQDLQKEQLERVNGQNIPGLTINRNATMRTVRAKDSNETYRVFVNSAGEQIGVTGTPPQGRDAHYGGEFVGDNHQRNCGKFLIHSFF